MDVSADDPSVVLRVSEQPALTSGPPGSFDEAGVVPCAVVEYGGETRLYYAGYEPPHNDRERFRAYCGLAVADAAGETFHRVSDTPVMGPSNEGQLFRVVHSILQDGDVWRVWYGAGGSFRQGRDKLLPVYDIRYCESADGINFPDFGELAVPLSGDEYRVGRPYVIRSGAGYEMFFGAGTEATIYRLAYAHSEDGRAWTRDDAALGLGPSPGEFDSEMLAYPAIVRTESSTFLFYNGNDYGRGGFGFAELVADDVGL